MKNYYVGADVLGEGIGDFVPWLGIVGKVAGGLTGGGGDSKSSNPLASMTGGKANSGGDTQKAVQEALAQERAHQAMAKVAKDATITKFAAFGAVGIIGLGVLVLAFRK